MIPVPEAGSRRSQFFECLPVACYACDRSGSDHGLQQPLGRAMGTRAAKSTDRFTGAHKVLDARGDVLSPEATGTAFLLRSGLPQLNRELVIESQTANA